MVAPAPAPRARRGTADPRARGVEDGRGPQRPASQDLPDPCGGVPERRGSASRRLVPLRDRQHPSGARGVRGRRRPRRAMDPALVRALSDGRRRPQLRLRRLSANRRVPELDGRHRPAVRSDARAARLDARGARLRRARGELPDRPPAGRGIAIHPQRRGTRLPHQPGSSRASRASTSTMCFVVSRHWCAGPTSAPDRSRWTR